MHKRSEREWNMALSVARLAPDTGMVTMTCAALLAGHADIERLRRENVSLLEDIREARSDEAHKFASRVNTLQARCQMVEDRYAMLCKQVAEATMAEKVSKT